MFEKLPYDDCGTMWPFADKIIVEPRRIDGSLDVSRIGADSLVNEMSKVRTSNDLAQMFFRYHKDDPEYQNTCSGQAVSNWLCDTGLRARTKTW